MFDHFSLLSLVTRCFFLKMGVTKIVDEPCQEDGSLVLTYGRWAAEVYIWKRTGEGDNKEGRSAIDDLLFSLSRASWRGHKTTMLRLSRVVEG